MHIPPTIYHLAEANNWPSIQQYGLLSTNRLLFLLGLSQEERREIEGQQRTVSICLSDGISIRDQKPIPPTALARCLVNTTPEQWYELLNNRVFFWLESERLNRMRMASKSIPQVVLSVDAAKLIERYAEQIAVTPINTGNARRQAAYRGLASFVAYDEWRRSGWESEAKGLRVRVRARSHRPVELTVIDSVPDILKFVTGVDYLAPGELFVDNTR